MTKHSLIIVKAFRASIRYEAINKGARAYTGQLSGGKADWLDEQSRVFWLLLLLNPRSGFPEVAGYIDGHLYLLSWEAQEQGGRSAETGVYT